MCVCAECVIIYRSYLRLLIIIDNDLVLFTPQALCLLPISVCIMSLYEEVKVHGYAEFCKAVSDRKGKDIFAYFSGDKDADGNSWCPDCVKAEPIVRGEIAHLPEGSVFIYCQVGQRDYWKNPNNDFKKTLKLSGVPTLLRYGTPQKLVEEECFKANLVRMMFTED